MSQTIDQVYSDFNVQGMPASGDKKPIKSEIRALLKMIQNSGGQAVTRNTLSALNGVTPPTEDYMGVVLADPTASNNGYYYRSGSAWVFGRPFPDTFAEVALSGSGTAQTGAVDTGVNPSGVEVFYARVTTPNTGPLTLSISGGPARSVRNLAGNPLSAGEWTGMVMFYLNDDEQYQLLIDAGSAAAAAASANRAEDEADRAQAIADGIAPGAVPDGGVTPVKLSDSAKNYLAGSGVLDARTVYRADDPATVGFVSGGAGSSTITFSGLTLQAGDYVWISGAGASPTQHEHSYTILGSPQYSGKLFIGCDGYIYNANDPDGGIPVLTTDTAAQVAAKIRAGSWAGWTVAGSGAQITFTRQKAGGTIGVNWSDIGFVMIPKNEAVISEGGGDLLARVLSVNGNEAQLSTPLGSAVSGALAYRELGAAINAAMSADPTLKEVVVPQGEFYISSALTFTQDGSVFRGKGLARTTLYPLPGPSYVLDFTSSITGDTMQGIVMEDFTIWGQNMRRHGIRWSRAWDGASARRILVTGFARGYAGWRVGKHPLSPAPSSANDQSVVSQTLTIENVTINRSNPSQDDLAPALYMEYVQEATLVNVKAGGGTDYQSQGLSDHLGNEFGRVLKIRI